MTRVMEKINAETINKDRVNAFAIGDTVSVHVKISEGGKERVQLYKGTVIARDSSGATETFTVRRISHGVGVERVFPVHSPHILKIEVTGSGHVRRAKLYYLRERTGKATRLRAVRRKDEGRSKAKKAGKPDDEPAPAVAEDAEEVRDEKTAE